MLTQTQKELLRSRFAGNTKFEVSNVVFDCYYGEWAVIKDNKHVDTFSFRLYNDQDFEQTINDIFYNAEKVMFQ